jgi:hypothetical protein
MRSKRDSWSGVDPRRDPGFVRARDLACRPPKNFTNLPDDIKEKCAEDQFRRALKWKWAFALGDPRLKSVEPDGTKRAGFFGPAVEVKDDKS